MTRVPVRRSQLIAPFGVGGMVIAPDGTSLIGAGLDHWYQRESGEKADDVDLQEFRVQEQRLQGELGVDFFRLPPDFRRPINRHQNVPNAFITMPYLRFPQWHVCPRPGCRRLELRGLAQNGRVNCSHCEKQGRKWTPMHQVPFVALCDAGHIQDFPFREWVHRSSNPDCRSGVLTLTAAGGGSLAGQTVKCECGKHRSLANITVVQKKGEWTYLSYKLRGDGSKSEEMDYPCPGNTPWLASREPDGCNRPLRGSLRSAANVYFAQARSSIYLPRDGGPMAELLTLFEQPPLSTQIATLRDLVPSITPELLRTVCPVPLKGYTNPQIAEVIEKILAPEPRERDEVPAEDPETSFRRPEYAALREPRNEPELHTRRAHLPDYEHEIVRYLSRLTLVDTLKETRAFTGFTRIFGSNSQSLDDRKAMLWRTPPRRIEWLPAYVVYGEGIYMELDERRVTAWERRPDVIDRIAPLMKRYDQVVADRRIQKRPLGPRFVLLHTFAHLVMLRLTFECGYGAASLRERLYASDNTDHSMAGILMYTADGDSEGTLGGLVRMGSVDNFEPVIRRALESAAWCSADPICMEVARQGGQGPNSLNLAACHGCALVPETSCELFNSLLDRGVVVGEPDNPRLGYFSDLFSGQR